MGLAAEWPFVSQPDYTGPLVQTLGGADISWLVGWFAAAVAYLLLVAFTRAPYAPEGAGEPRWGLRQMRASRREGRCVVTRS